MGKTICVDDNIQGLVKAFNEIEGCETTSCCGGHNDRECAYISFNCKDDIIDFFVRLVAKHEGLNLNMFKHPLSSSIIWCTLNFGPFWEVGQPGAKTLTELFDDVLMELRSSDLRKKQCEFHLLSQLSDEEVRTQWEPDFSAGHALMTPQKFNLLKSFVFNKWNARIEYLKAKFSFEAVHIPQDGLPFLSGDLKVGTFYYHKSPINIWDIRWRAKVIVMLLTLPEHGKQVVKQMPDIQGITFENDDIIKALLR